MTTLPAAGDAGVTPVPPWSRLSLCAYASRATPPAMSRKPPIGKRRRPTSISAQPKMRELQRMRCGPGGGMCIGGASRLSVVRVTPLYEGCARETRDRAHHVPARGVIPTSEETPPLLPPHPSDAQPLRTRRIRAHQAHSQARQHGPHSRFVFQKICARFAPEIPLIAEQAQRH